MEIYKYQHIWGTRKNEPRNTRHTHFPTPSVGTSSSSSKNWWNKDNLSTSNKTTQV